MEKKNKKQDTNLFANYKDNPSEIYYVDRNILRKLVKHA